MTVIPFPQKAPQQALSEVSSAVAGHLTVAAIRDLTTFEFPENFCEDEAGTLVLEPDDWQKVSEYLTFHGLRLPSDAHAQTTHDLWRELRGMYGQAVRLASQGRGPEIAGICDELTPDQRAYAVAVGSQSTAMARQRARALFTGRHRVMFTA